MFKDILAKYFNGQVLFPLIYDAYNTAAGVLTILRERLSKLLADNDTKAIQKIVISLGHISFKEKSVAHLNIALDLIFGLCRSKVCGYALAFESSISFSFFYFILFLCVWGKIPVIVMTA